MNFDEVLEPAMFNIQAGKSCSFRFFGYRVNQSKLLSRYKEILFNSSYDREVRKRISFLFFGCLFGLQLVETQGY